MSEPRTPKPTREEIAQLEVGRTDIGPRTATALVAAFLVLIAAVPLIEVVGQWRAGIAALDLVRRPPRVDEFAFPIHRGAQPEVDRLRQAEHAIEDASWPRHALQPLVQERLTGWLRTGNSQVVIGRDDWLFYRPGVDYAAGPGFLSPAQRAVRPRQHPDPRPAILDFHRACAAAGIRLILVPVPDKAMLHPEQLSRALAGRLPDNADYARFAAEMAAEGVEIRSPLELLRARAANGAVFLHQDTHWTPEAMDAVAESLAVQLAPAVTNPWHTAPLPAARVGDLVDTLKLPAEQALYRPQALTVQQVRDADERPWTADGHAEVLLLGDSFSNIYSEPRMGWGEAAGFAPHLALHLGRAVDVIAVNGGGAHATRRALADELARGHDRLSGTRVVVWEFAVRELAVGEWPVIPLVREAAASTATGFVPANGETVEVTATVVGASAAPRPGSVPYKDHLISVRCTDLVGADPRLAGRQLRAYVWSMRGNVWTPSATWRAGDRVRLRVQPWDDVADDLERLNRAELDGLEAAGLEPCFAEPIP